MRSCVIVGCGRERNDALTREEEEVLSGFGQLGLPSCSLPGGTTLAYTHTTLRIKRRRDLQHKGSRSALIRFLANRFPQSPPSSPTRQPTPPLFFSPPALSLSLSSLAKRANTSERGTGPKRQRTQHRSLPSLPEKGRLRSAFHLDKKKKVLLLIPRRKLLIASQRIIVFGDRQMLSSRAASIAEQRAVTLHFQN